MMIHPSCAKFYLIVFYSSSIATDSHNVQWNKTKRNSIIWLFDYLIIRLFDEKFHNFNRKKIIRLKLKMFGSKI